MQRAKVVATARATDTRFWHKPELLPDSKKYTVEIDLQTGVHRVMRLYDFKQVDSYFNFDNAKNRCDELNEQYKAEAAI